MSSFCTPTFFFLGFFLGRVDLKEDGPQSRQLFNNTSWDASSLNKRKQTSSINDYISNRKCQTIQMKTECKMRNGKFKYEQTVHFEEGLPTDCLTTVVGQKLPRSCPTMQWNAVRKGRLWRHRLRAYADIPVSSKLNSVAGSQQNHGAQEHAAVLGCGAAGNKQPCVFN